MHINVLFIYLLTTTFGVLSKVLNTSSDNCPYERWGTVAKTSCINPDHFHCLKDENRRLVWVCAEPIWVDKGMERV